MCPFTPLAWAAAAAASDIPWHAEELCRLKPVTNSSMLLSATLEATGSRRWGAQTSQMIKYRGKGSTWERVQTSRSDKASHGHTPFWVPDQERTDVVQEKQQDHKQNR